MTNSMSAIIKFINGKNDKRDYLSGAIDYVTDATKTNGGALVATQGCSRSHILDDMLVNKVLHHKTHGKHGVHFVLAFPPNGNERSPADILDVTRKIVSTLYPDYLAVMAVHTDSKALHSHVILDAVNAVTGKKFSQGPSDLNRVKQKTNAILHDHGFELIRASANDFVDYTDYSSAIGFDFLELDESYFVETELLSEPDRFETVSPDDLLSPEEFAAVSRRLHEARINPYSAFEGVSYMKPQNQYKSKTLVPATQFAPVTPATLSSTDINTTENITDQYPTTTVVTGPTFRIKGTPQSNFAGLGELVTQTTEFAQDHQREAANLALAMQSKTQEIRHPTNVSVIAGPIFDIDLTPRLNTRYCVFGGNGIEPYEEDT